MRIGSGFTTGQYCRIEAANTAEIFIGNNVQINDRCHIAAMNLISIADNVLIASDVYITDHDHGDISLRSLKIPPNSREINSSEVKIEKNVWIGEKAIILKGVSIGESSVIAAGAVVTKDVPAFSVVAGVPARLIKLKNDI